MSFQRWKWFNFYGSMNLLPALYEASLRYYTAKSCRLLVVFKFLKLNDFRRRYLHSKSSWNGTFLTTSSNYAYSAYVACVQTLLISFREVLLQWSLRVGDQILVLHDARFPRLRNQVIESDSKERLIETWNVTPTHSKVSLANFVHGSTN